MREKRFKTTDKIDKKRLLIKFENHLKCIFIQSLKQKLINLRISVEYTYAIKSMKSFQVYKQYISDVRINNDS